MYPVFCPVADYEFQFFSNEAIMLCQYMVKLVDNVFDPSCKEPFTRSGVPYLGVYSVSNALNVEVIYNYIVQ